MTDVIVNSSGVIISLASSKIRVITLMAIIS